MVTEFQHENTPFFNTTSFNNSLGVTEFQITTFSNSAALGLDDWIGTYNPADFPGESIHIGTFDGRLFAINALGRRLARLLLSPRGQGDGSGRSRFLGWFYGLRRTNSGNSGQPVTPQ